MDHGIQEFELQDDEPRRKIQTQGEADLPELIWRNGPVAMEVGGEKFGTFMVEEIFKEEEMAWFLQYQIDDDCGGGRICGEGCLFAAPIVDEAEEGEEQRIDVKLGKGMIGEATEKVKMMDPAPIIAAAIVNKAAEEEQRIDVELGQGNPEETVMDSAPIVDEAAEGEEQRIDMELGQEMVGEASSVEATLMDSREKPAAVTRRRSVIAVEEKAGSSFSPIWKRNQKNQKARRGDEHDPQSEDAELETELRKDTRRQAAQARRRRAAEVHNLSERKRRDRINEKMKTLQNLVPRCNKTNKASMLHDAIEYLKSLKLHIQMMSTGFNMRPMIFPGAPSYFPPMTTGPMAIGTSLNTGLNPLMQCGPLLPTGSLSPTTLMPSLHSSSITPGQQDPSLNHINTHRPCLVQIPNYTDINQHYVSHHQPQTSFQAKDPTIINQQQL